MDESIGLKADPIDVRARLLKAINCRKVGVSRYELSKRMRATASNYGLMYYDETLTSLIEEGLVALSYCGLDNHKIAVYRLRDPQEHVSPDERTKVCRACKQTKQIITFRKRTDSRDGHCGECRSCENERRRRNKWNYKPVENWDAIDVGQLIVEEPAMDQAKMEARDKELADAARVVRTRSLETHRLKFKGARYIVVDGRAVLARKEISPIEEYDRAWRRIRTSKITSRPVLSAEQG